MTDPPRGSSGPEPSSADSNWELGDFFFMGTACAISVVAGGGVGYGLDSWLGTLPWLTFAGLLFGVVSAVMISVKQYRKVS